MTGEEEDPSVPLSDANTPVSLTKIFTSPERILITVQTAQSSSVGVKEPPAEEPADAATQGSKPTGAMPMPEPILAQGKFACDDLSN